MHKRFSGLFLFRRLVFRSAGSDGSEWRFRSSEVAVKQRSALRSRVPLDLGHSEIVDHNSPEFVKALNGMKV